MTRTLILLRHGQSEWNEKNLFTGIHDVALTAKGRGEAEEAGLKIKNAGFIIDQAFTSALKRAQHTAALALNVLGQGALPVPQFAVLNERDYGRLTGMNKDEARQTYGEEQVHIWRRSYDIAPPEGESLKDTAARVLPFYLTDILPAVMRGQTVLVAAHGNSLRALVMVLEGHDKDSILKREIATGEPLVYTLGEDTRPLKQTSL